MNFVPTIDHTLNTCVTEPKRFIKPYIPRRVFEDIDTQVSVSFPAVHDVPLPKTEGFINRKEMKEKCRALGIHKRENFTPPNSSSWPAYVAAFILVGYILK